MFLKSCSKITLLKYCLGFSFLLGANATHSQQDSVKILFVGNSYTHMNNMPGIFDRIATLAGQSVIVEKSAKSGASFQEHSTRADLFEAIKKRKWDYVVLQGFSRELAYSIEQIDTATVPYVSMIKDSILQNNHCTKILFYMTWGYEEGYQVLEELNNYEKMADSIARGYTYLGDVFGFPVVPVGMVWKEVKNNTKIDLYADDRAHPSKNGSFLIASTFYNAIFNTSLDKVFSNTIQSDDAKQIKQIMQDFMLLNRERYGLHNNQVEILNKSFRDKFIVSYNATFPKTSSYRWDFGDGRTSDAAGGIQIYDKAGKYLITLTVTDECGNKSVYKRNLEIKPPVANNERSKK